MQYFLLDELLLLVGEPHLVHLARELVPCLLPLPLFILSLCILVLDVGFGTLCLLTGTVAELSCSLSLRSGSTRIALLSLSSRGLDSANKMEK